MAFTTGHSEGDHSPRVRFYALNFYRKFILLEQKKNCLALLGIAEHLSDLNRVNKRFFYSAASVPC